MLLHNAVVTAIAFRVNVYFVFCLKGIGDVNGNGEICMFKANK